MREIKFRGKINKESAFIYGSLLIIGQETYIYPYNNGDLDDIDFGYGFEKVLPETVGQFTGLHDKNGKEIYEGDILNYDCSPNYIVEWQRDGWKMVCDVGNGDSCQTITSFMKIIGNMHENPELRS